MQNRKHHKIRIRKKKKKKKEQQNKTENTSKSKGYNLEGYLFQDHLSVNVKHISGPFWGVGVGEGGDNQCSTTSMPSVSVIAQGLFCGTKYAHHTFLPIISIRVVTLVSVSFLVILLSTANEWKKICQIRLTVWGSVMIEKNCQIKLWVSVMNGKTN